MTAPVPRPRSAENVLLDVRVHSPHPTVVLVRPVGELDLSTAPLLRERLECELGRRAHVVVDLHEVTFLSASGACVLIEAQQSAPDGPTQLHVTGVDGPVTAVDGPVTARVFQITGLSRVLPVVDDTADVLVARLAELAGTGIGTG